MPHCKLSYITKHALVAMQKGGELAFIHQQILDTTNDKHTIHSVFVFVGQHRGAHSMYGLVGLLLTGHYLSQR